MNKIEQIEIENLENEINKLIVKNKEQEENIDSLKNNLDIAKKLLKGDIDNVLQINEDLKAKINNLKSKLKELENN